MNVRFPIAFKLIVTTTVVVAVVASILMSTSYLRTQRQLEQNAARLRDAETRNLVVLGTSTAENLASTIGGPLLDNDLAIVDDAVKQLVRAQNSIVRARVIRPDGRIVVTSELTGLGTEVDAETSTALAGLESSAKLLTAFDANQLPPRLRFVAPVRVGARRLGSVDLELSTSRVEESLSTIANEAQEAMRNGVRTTIGVGVLALVFGAAIAVFQGLRMARSIRSLAEVANRVGEGDLDAKAERTTDDEVGLLCDRFNEMTGRVKGLMKETASQAALERELEQAREIQKSLVPTENVHESSGLQLSGSTVPATQVGGDWWNYYDLGDGRTLVCVGDVTGHGIPSALLTATAKACADAYLHRKGIEFSLTGFQETLDYAVRQAGKGELVMTMVSALFDTKREELEVINSGHDFPVLIRGGRTSSIVARGARLGDSEQFHSKTFKLATDDVVLFYTDGIVEGRDHRGMAFGTRRLRDSLQIADKLRDAGMARDHILAEAQRFYGDTVRDDDLTVIVCRVAA